MMKNVFAVLLLLCLPSFLLAQNTRKVLILGIDGCRQDALQNAATPNLDGLLNYAVYSYDALTHAPTWSATGWSTMLTGVWETKHGAYSNAFTNTNYTDWPSLFSRVESYDPMLNTVSVCTWGPINDNIVTVADSEITLTNNDAAVKNEGVDLLTNSDPDVLFLDFSDVDYAGHANGFTANGATYLSVIETTDGYVGEVLTALQNRSTYAQEEWLIMVATDHGGNTSGHGGTTFAERNVFMIAARPGTDPVELGKTVNTVPVTDALQLNNSGQHLKPADSSPFAFGANTDFSIEMRVRATSLTGDASFMSNKNRASGFNTGWIISTPNSQSQWKVNIGDGSSRADLNGGIIDDGDWHHLTVTCDRDGMMKIYHDGEFQGETSIANIGNLDSGFDLHVGQDGTGSYGFPYNGSLREIRIFNTVLDAQTVQDYACQTFDAAHPNGADLLAYYPMNEGSGTTMTNTADAANPLTLINGTANWSTPVNNLICTDYDNTPRQPDLARRCWSI